MVTAGGLAGRGAGTRTGGLAGRGAGTRTGGLAGRGAGTRTGGLAGRGAGTRTGGLAGRGAGTRAGSEGFRPSEPDAGSTVPPASIVQRSGSPKGVESAAGADSHVQSTSAETPVCRATIRPSELVTVTVQGSDDDSWAVKRTGPPTRPLTAGA